MSLDLLWIAALSTASSEEVAATPLPRAATIRNILKPVGMLACYLFVSANLHTGLLATAGAKPAPNTNQPNPTRAVTAYNQLSFTDSFKLTLLGKDQFFGAPGVGPNYDWPNPTRPLAHPVTKLTWAQSLNPANPFSLERNFDQPNPTRKVTAYNQLSFTDSFKLTLLGKDTFFGPAGLGPSYSWPNPTTRPNTAVTWLQSLQTTTLAPAVGQDPFSLLRNWDQPNPVKKVTSYNQLSFTHSVDLNLLGQDTFFGSAGKGPSYDWPNPTRPLTRLITNLTWLVSLQGSTLAPAASDPFSRTRNFNQPNPTLAKWAVRPITLRPEELELPTPVPFKQGNWQNPIRLQRPILNYEFSFYYVQDVSVPFPAQPYNWANPTQKRDSRHLLGFVHKRPHYYANPTLFEISRAHSFNPIRKIPSVFEVGSGSRLALTSALPFGQKNWPNPASKPSNRHALGFTHERIRGFNETFTLPCNNYDWPNPVIRKENRSLLGFTFERRTYYPEPTPGKLFDWPNPNRKLTLVPDVGTSAFPVLRAEAPVMAPFSLNRIFDWPNPVLKTNTVFLRTPTTGNVRIFGDGAAPCNVLEWPNPKGYIASIGLRSSLYSPTIDFLLSSAIPLPRLVNSTTRFLEPSKLTSGIAGFNKKTKRINE